MDSGELGTYVIRDGRVVLLPPVVKIVQPALFDLGVYDPNGAPCVVA